MRVVVGLGSSRDLRQIEHERHLHMMSRFLERIPSDAGAGDAHGLTLVLRSAESGAAQALVDMKDALANARVAAKVVVARLDPGEDLRQLFSGLSDLAPNIAAGELIRWARNPRLLDAHEQVTYGTAMCWSGDAMRREADKRNALTLFHEAAPDIVRLSRLAFEALWAASSLVPERRLHGSETVKPSGAYELGADAPVAVSPVRQALQGWPLIRH